MNVGADRTAECQPVGAGLLLNDAPGRTLPSLHADEVLDQFRPLDARLGFDHAMLGTEANDPPHRSNIEKDRILGELLAAHCVPSACNANWLAFHARGCQCRPQRRLRINGYNTIDARGVELRMDIIDQDARSGTPRSKGKEGKPCRGLRDDTKRLTSCGHLGS